MKYVFHNVVSARLEVGYDALWSQLGTQEWIARRATFIDDIGAAVEAEIRRGDSATDVTAARIALRSFGEISPTGNQ